MLKGYPPRTPSQHSAGDADYIHMPNPQAQTLIEDGAGYLAASLGNEHGYLCYSSFAATPAFIDQQPEVVHRFVRGFYKAQQWLAASDPARSVAERVKPFFPGVPDSVLQSKHRPLQVPRNLA